MDLGRFNEATESEAGAPTVDGADSGAPPDSGSSGVDASGPFGCLNLPGETLDPNPVTARILVYNSIATFKNAEAIDGGSAIDMVVYTPFPGITIQSCLMSDPGCGTPVTTPTKTDDGGIVSLTLSGTFDGFFRGTGENFYSFNLFPGQWPAGDKEATYAATGTTPGQMELMNAAIGGSVDLDASSGVGIVFVTIFDCFDHTVSGVSISLSRSGPDTMPIYFVSGVPNPTVQVTDKGGAGGAVNVPTGALRVTATHLATSTTLGSIDMYVRPGELNLGWIRMRSH